MRVRTLWIEGYGRFSLCTLQLNPGLQVIVGPNEQGKTTVRNFIGDMLYGQKRSAAQRLYDESHTLRRPWRSPHAYGGRLLYHLDDGREVEVIRSFDKRNESVHVFDKTHAREITHEYPRLRNHEPTFADAHLGLSKTVFLSTASIGHLDLDALGNDDALGQIRERILALADSGEDMGSSEEALKRLEAHIGAIGRPQARTKPLPQIRARLQELDAERENTLAKIAEVSHMMTRRSALLNEIADLKTRRAAVEEELRAVETHTQADRLRQVEELYQRIQEIQKRCFAMSNVRDFPLERAPEVQRAQNMVVTAQSALDRTRTEQAEAENQLAVERERLGEVAGPASQDIPDAVDQELGAIESDVARCQDDIERAEFQAAAARTRMEAAQQDVARLPDFSRMAANPMEWLQQLATSFQVERQARDDETNVLITLRRHVERLHEETAEPRRIFEGVEDFPSLARTFEVDTRVRDEQIVRQHSRLDALQNLKRDYASDVPTFRNMALLGLALMAVFTAAAMYFQNTGIYVPAAGCLVMVLWYASSYRSAKRDRTRAEAECAETEQELAALESAFHAKRAEMETLLERSGCATPRELEALHDRLRVGAERLEELTAALREQERRTEEKHLRVVRLFEQHQRAFAELGETLEHEDHVAEMATRAIARYQEYRDAKRRLAENRDLAAQYEADLERLRAELDVHQRRDVEKSLEVRKLLRERGFRDEHKHTSALSALRAYRIRTAQLRQKQGRLEVLQERLAGLERQRAAEEKDLAKHEESLRRQLEAVGVDSLEAWQTLADQARQYREAWEERGRLTEQTRLILGGDDIDELRRAVAQSGTQEKTSDRSVADIRTELDGLLGRFSAKQEEAHAIQIAATEHVAGLRSINEIEEEQAELLLRREQLQFELDAAAYAAERIEEVARDRHARIAPKLASQAAQYLSEITGGAYAELFLNRDLGITVRIPQTDHLDDHPERRLSKGTVDQIYLSLRLALVQALSDSGESIPMLLDDPFSNYDDARLERAMGLLARIGQTAQVLLFTCREDVVRVAEAVDAPVLRL